MKGMRIDGIVGARPNMMKMAPLAQALAADGTFHLRLIHTGQHYDEALSGAFFKELRMPAPGFNLGVGSGTQGEQTARIIDSYERLLLAGPMPRGVIVVGDVNSTMACALVAAKLGVPVAHVEAGLRSGDRTMPEEVNRIVTDALSDLLFVSDPDGLSCLAAEGRPRERTWFVGNVMMDTLHQQLPGLSESSILDDMGLEPGGYAYLTLHRPSNVDDPQTLKRLIDLFVELSKDVPFVFAIHPRTRARLEETQIVIPKCDSFRLIPPLGYRDNLRIQQSAKVVLTDSGGIQEETSVLGVPCLTLRFRTERPVTVELGSSELVGSDPSLIHGAWDRLMSGSWKPSSPIPLWDGKTAPRIVSRLVREWAS